MSCIFHSCKLVLHFHVPQFPPMQTGDANSCLAFSGPALSPSKDGAVTCGAESWRFPLGVCSSVPNLAMIGKWVYTGDPPTFQSCPNLCGHVWLCKTRQFFWPQQCAKSKVICCGYTCRTRSRFAESEVVIKGQQIEYKNKLNKLYRSDKITPAICKKATKYFVHTHDVQALRVIAEQEDEQAQQISHSDKQRNETKILQSEFTSHNFYRKSYDRVVICCHRVSIISRSSTKTTKCTITLTMPHNS